MNHTQEFLNSKNNCLENIALKEELEHSDLNKNKKYFGISINDEGKEYYNIN
jgi:hypothetical protein